MKELNRKKDIVEWAGLALYWLSALAVAYSAIRYAPLLIHSDVASDMVLGRAMAQGGSWLDPNWYHANALPVIDLLYLRGLLIEWTGNWALVRVLMALLLFGLVQLSALYALRAMGFTKREFYYGGTLLLLICAAGMNSMQQYALAIVYYYVELGLFFGCMAAWKDKKPRGKAFYLRFALLMLLVFAAGLSSTRHSISIFLPLCMAAFFNLLADVPLTERLRRGDSCIKALGESRSAKALALTVAMLLTSAAGVGARVLLLWERYHFTRGYGSLTTQVNFTSRAMAAAEDFFGVFGYAGNESLMTISGLACLVAVAIVVALCIVTITLWRRVRENRKDEPAWNDFLLWSYACVMGVTLISVVFSSTTSDPRYFYFPLAFFVPVLAAYIARRDYRSMLLPGIGVLLAAACFVNCVFLARREGKIAEKDAFTGQQTAQVFDFLRGEGYTDGFAPFWHASVNVERSNGEFFITPVDVILSDSGEEVKIYAKRWLSFAWAFEDDYLQNGERKFFLLPKISTRDEWQDKSRDAVLSQTPCALLDASERVFENDAYIVYALPEALKCDGDPGTLESAAPARASEALEAA